MSRQQAAQPLLRLSKHDGLEELSAHTVFLAQEYIDIDRLGSHGTVGDAEDGREC